MNRGRRLLPVLIALTLLFIWGNSLFDSDTSSRESGAVLEIFNYIFGDGAVSEHLIRKLAHFSEFALLGAELYCWFGRYPMSIAHGLFAAVADESLQLLSGRGSQVGDVLLDFAGAVFGAAMCMLIIYMLRKKNPLP